MGEKSERIKALDAAIINSESMSRLASLYEYGHLMASVNPTAFLTMVYNNVVELRERLAERKGKEGEW